MLATPWEKKCCGEGVGDEVDGEAGGPGQEAGGAWEQGDIKVAGSPSVGVPGPHHWKQDRLL